MTFHTNLNSPTVTGVTIGIETSGTKFTSFAATSSNGTIKASGTAATINGSLVGQ